MVQSHHGCLLLVLFVTDLGLVSATTIMLFATINRFRNRKKEVSQVVWDIKVKVNKILKVLKGNKMNHLPIIHKLNILAGIK
jgi:hypothetical protein